MHGSPAYWEPVCAVELLSRDRHPSVVLLLHPLRLGAACRAQPVARRSTNGSSWCGGEATRVTRGPDPRSSSSKRGYLMCSSYLTNSTPRRRVGRDGGTRELDSSIEDAGALEQDWNSLACWVTLREENIYHSYTRSAWAPRNLASWSLCALGYTHIEVCDCIRCQKSQTSQYGIKVMVGSGHWTVCMGGDKKVCPSANLLGRPWTTYFTRRCLLRVDSLWCMNVTREGLGSGT